MWARASLGLARARLLLRLAAISVAATSLIEAAGSREPRKLVNKLAEPINDNQSELKQTLQLTGSIFVAGEPSSGARRRQLATSGGHNQDGLPLVGLKDCDERTDDQGPPAQTLAQFEDPINQVKEQRPQDITLFQTIKSQNNLTSRGPELSTFQVRELNRDFLSLFDELWKIKNTSVTALVKLDYFTNQTILEPNQPGGANGSLQSQWPAAGNGTRNGPLKSRPQQQQVAQSKANPKNGLALAAARLTGWLSTAQRRIQLTLDGLCHELVYKLSFLQAINKQWARQAPSRHQDNRNQSRPTNIFENSDRPDRLAPAEEPELGPSAAARTLTRRSVTLDSSAGASLCREPAGPETAKCRSLEQLVAASLNSTFPGTLKSIEEHCKSITSLLADCWPGQLQQLRGSLSSWNETLLQNTDFPLPAGFLEMGPPAFGASCGVPAQTPQLLRDRISWMWLNLCIDKKFRLDYVDNLRCLSTWSQEKAQQSCASEYKRMHLYLDSQAETGNGISFEWAQGNNNQRTRLPPPSSSSSSQLPARPASNSDVELAGRKGEKSPTMAEDAELASVGEPIAANVNLRPQPQQQQQQQQVFSSGDTGLRSAPISEAELTDREVSSKMLCCMFDQFLRCAHKQAVRDCGRPGAQFVVNFMSRIGTDDMKYLCNSETKTAGRGSSRSSQRRLGSHDSRSPFIDGHYCTDPRIQVGLSSNPLDRAGSSSGSGGAGGIGASSSGGLRTSSNRNKLRDKGVISHDPAFFGSDREVVQSGASRVFNRHYHTAIMVIIAIVVCCGYLFPGSD